MGLRDVWQGLAGRVLPRRALERAAWQIQLSCWFATFVGETDEIPNLDGEPCNEIEALEAKLAEHESLLWWAGHEEPLRLARVGLTLYRQGKINDATKAWMDVDRMLTRLTGTPAFDGYSWISAKTLSDDEVMAKLDEINNVDSARDVEAAMLALELLRERIGPKRFDALNAQRRAK